LCLENHNQQIHVAVQGDTFLDWRKNMKTLVAVAALAAVIASPAFAQSTRQHVPPRAQAPRALSYDYGQSQHRRVVSPNAAYDINGEYLGSDPDPTVREQMERDSGAE
jgi:hypothetical protein